MTNGIIIRNGVKYAGGSSSSSSDVKVVDVVEKGNKNAVSSNAVANAVENISDSLEGINTNLGDINSQITDVVNITPSTDISTLPKGIFPIQVANQTFGEVIVSGTCRGVCFNTGSVCHAYVCTSIIDYAYIIAYGQNTWRAFKLV